MTVIGAIGAGLLALGAYLLYGWSDERRKMIAASTWHEMGWMEAYLELAVSVAMIVAGAALVIAQ